VIGHQTLAELRDPSSALVAELADRLAFLCATLLATALAESVVAPSAAHTAATSAPRVAYRRSEPSPGRDGAVLIDELEDDLRPLARSEPPAPAALAQRPAQARVQPPPPGAAPESSRRPPRGARPWDMPLREEPSSVDPPPVGEAASGEPVAASGEPPTLRIRRTSDVHYEELR
jgi:hypothetical protein